MMKKYIMTALLVFGTMATHAQLNDSISTDSTMWFNQTHQLGEVVVKSRLPKVKTNAEGIKVTIVGSELEKIGSSKDLLKRLPTVKSADDGVEIFGRGKAEVYVNGRKLYDMKELEQIPSDQILNVEIINNPGARYAASTTAVIRIKTKRPQGEGWGFRNELKAYHDVMSSISDQFNINYRQGGLDVLAMLMGNAQNTGSGAYEYLDVYYGGQLMRQTIDKVKYRTHIRQLGTLLQVNYQFDDNHSIGARYSFNRTPSRKDHSTLPSVFTLGGSPLQESMSVLDQRIPYHMHSANLYYSGKVRQWQLDANIDGVWNGLKTLTDTKEDVTIPGQPTVHKSVSTYAHSTSSLYAVKLVAEHPLWGGSISFGTEYDATHRQEESINPTASDGDTKVDENIFALFAEYKHQIFKKLNLQAGLRFESVNSDYYEWSEHKMSRDYNDWFPSIGLSMPVGKVYMSANYGIDIARPSFSNLSGNVYYVNAYSYQGGNPYLKPTYNHNLSLNASWKWLFASAMFSHVKDDIQIQNISYSDDDPLITLLHPNNLKAYNRFTLQAFASPTLFKRWHPTWGAVVLGQDYETQIADGSILKLKRPLAQFMWNNLVDLPHGWRVGLDLMAMTTGDYATYRLHRPCVTIDASLYKSFFNDKLELRLQATDLTAVRSQPITIYSYRNLHIENKNYTYYEFKLTYKFNVANDKYRGRGAGDKQKSRIQ